MYNSVGERTLVCMLRVGGRRYDVSCNLYYPSLFWFNSLLTTRKEELSYSADFGRAQWSSGVYNRGMTH